MDYVPVIWAQEDVLLRLVLTRDGDLDQDSPLRVSIHSADEIHVGMMSNIPDVIIRNDGGVMAFNPTIQFHSRVPSLWRRGVQMVVYGTLCSVAAEVLKHVSEN